MSYLQDAKDDAHETISNFEEQIAEQLCEKGTVSDDLHNDYAGGDSYHHETHVDKAYGKTESMELLVELDDYEETDSGLWEGLGWAKQLSARAAFTYGNAVMHFWREKIKEINDAFYEQFCSGEEPSDYNSADVVGFVDEWINPPKDDEVGMERVRIEVTYQAKFTKVLEFSAPANEVEGYIADASGDISPGDGVYVQSSFDVTNTERLEPTGVDESA